MSYNTIKELLSMAEERNVLLSQIVLETEMTLLEVSKEHIYNEMENRYNVMKSSAKKAP